MPEERVIVWVVTPHHSSEFDEWWGRARDEGCNDEDAHAALEYAQERLEQVWDEYEFGSGPAQVTIEQREVGADEAEGVFDEAAT